MRARVWVGPYQVIAPLGKGGMGAMYLARAAFGGEVALKTLQLPHRGLPAGLRRELEAMRRLSPPGIVRIKG